MPTTTPTRKEIEQKVIELAAKQGAVDPKEVLPASHFVNDLGYDSLDRVEFAMSLEDEFSLSIPDEQAEKAQFVEDAIRFIIELLDPKE